MINFIFTGGPDVSLEKGHTAVIPREIASKEELLNILHELLVFPEYDGRNWDALHELLRDFWWIDQEHITIIHQDVPNLSRQEQKNYLEILDDSIKSWLEDMEQRDENTPWKAHILHVYFPESERTHIERILNSGNDNED